MKRAELFALSAGTIGLIADAIGLSAFLFQRASVSSPGTETSLLLKLIAVFSLIYGWFIISWILVRRSWIKTYPIKSSDVSDGSLTRSERRAMRRNRKFPNFDAFQKKVRYTVIGIGVLLLPLQILFFSTVLSVQDAGIQDTNQSIIQYRWVGFIFLVSLVALAVIGAVVHLSVELLMPIIYDDMEREI